MLRQTFVVTLEVPSPFDRNFPKVETERMASYIREGVEAKSISFMGATPFRIRVERTEEATSVSGEIREYSLEEFPEIEEAIREPVGAMGAAQVR